VCGVYLVIALALGSQVHRASALCCSLCVQVTSWMCPLTRASRRCTSCACVA